MFSITWAFFTLCLVWKTPTIQVFPPSSGRINSLPLWSILFWLLGFHRVESAVSRCGPGFVWVTCQMGKGPCSTLVVLSVAYGPITTASPRNLLEMQIFRLCLPPSHRIRSTGQRLGCSYFNKPPGGSDAHWSLPTAVPLSDSLLSVPVPECLPWAVLLALFKHNQRIGMTKIEPNSTARFTSIH